MYGVVLWSDKQDRNALIWCEDHGDLAYFRQDDALDSVTLDAGDWIQFDIETVHRQRVASNPRLVAEGLYCGLPGRLNSAGDAPGAPRRVTGADVIPLRP